MLLMTISSANIIIELIKQNNTASLVGNLDLGDKMDRLSQQFTCTDVPNFTTKLANKFATNKFAFEI